MSQYTFQRFEEEFVNSTTIIYRLLTQLDSCGGNVDHVIATSVEVEGELAEANGYLVAMDVEFERVPSAEKQKAREKIKDSKEEYDRIEKTYKESQFKAEALALKGGGVNTRAKLQSLNSKLDQSTAMLESSRMMVAQTEDIGNTILTDLENQKDTLIGAQAKVTQTKEYTVEAKGILNSMGKRACMQKVCLFMTIIVLAAAIGVILYFGFINNKNQGNNR